LATPGTPQRAARGREAQRAREAAATPVERGSLLLGELLSVHRAKIIAALLAIMVLGAAGIFYRRSAELRQQRAETSYFRARQAFEARNLELAESDLQTVVTRYPNTAGGAMSAMTLAQILYETERAQEGITVLRDVVRRAPRPMRADVHALIAMGHENLGQFAEAAGEYQAASRNARFPRDQLAYRAAEARALTAAGRNEEALEIWRELEAEPTQFMANEARVRIGELTARPEG
jgi:tetratricopeptide (TPR) repeat protein